MTNTEPSGGLFNGRLSRIRAWRTRTKVLLGVPTGVLLLAAGFLGVRGVQYGLAEERDLATLIPPGAQAVVRVKDLPRAWPTLRSSPLARLLLGGAPRGDVAHQAAARMAGRDPLPSLVTEDRLLSICGDEAVAAVYDVDDPSADVVVAVRLPFLYYALLPFADLAADRAGAAVSLRSVGKDLVVATRRERAADAVAAKTAVPIPAPPAGFSIAARIDLEAMPAEGSFRRALVETLEGVPFRETFHAVDARALRSLSLSVSGDGTRLALDGEAAVDGSLLDRRLVSLYAQPPLPAALLERLPARAAALSCFRIQAARDWAFLRALADEPDRANKGEELGEALKFAYANLGQVLDEFEKKGFLARLAPLVGDSAAVAAAQAKSEDILLGAAAVVVAVALTDEKGAARVLDEFTGADLPEGERKGIRLQRYNDHIVRVVEVRSRANEGVCFAYAVAGKTLVAGTSLPLVGATLDCLDGQGRGLSTNAAMTEVLKGLPGGTLGQEFLWVDLAELSRALSASAYKFAQERADRLIDHRALRAELEAEERPRCRPEELDDRVSQLFMQRIRERTEAYAKEIRDEASRLAELGTAGLSIEGSMGALHLRGVLRLAPQGK